MISAEKLLDSLENLPDDLLRETEVVRNRKPVSWVRWTALAACLCLCAGLWFALPNIMVSTDEAATGSVQENALADMEKGSASTVNHIDAIVYSVAEDHIVVTTDQIVEQIPGKDGTSVQLIQFTVTFENMDHIPHFKPGQDIRIHYHTIDEDNKTVSPYKVEIVNEQEVQQ